MAKQGWVLTRRDSHITRVQLTRGPSHAWHLYTIQVARSCLGFFGDTPAAERQWWGDRLGDEWGSLQRHSESTHGFPPPEGPAQWWGVLAQGAHGEG